eukprot:15452592-Alexandrium_andersonii.AAC.1
MQQHVQQRREPLKNRKGPGAAGSGSNGEPLGGGKRPPGPPMSASGAGRRRRDRGWDREGRKPPERSAENSPSPQNTARSGLQRLAALWR